MSDVAAEPLLTIPASVAAAQADKANALYEASVPTTIQKWKRAINAAYTAAGLCALVWLSWAEPFSAKLFAKLLSSGAPRWAIDFLAAPLTMILRGVLFVEAFGYAYHRFFQHLGWLTRRALFFRRNQRFHWMHHMIIYPIGRFYKRDTAYISSEGGLGISWSAPAAVAIVYAFYSMGFHFATFVFVAAMASYAYFVVDDVHARFHLMKHSYLGHPYFKWMEDIHILHHWDQRMNFTIVYPLMDMLFGTYLSPEKHQRELAVAYEDNELTCSDFINWRYLLLEATPVEYAAFISEAKRHPRSLRKIGHLMEVLHHRTTLKPEDGLAREMQTRARDLLAVVRPA
jgi:hypothetical protein